MGFLSQGYSLQQARSASQFNIEAVMSRRSQSLCLEPPDLNFFKALPIHLESGFGACKQNRHKDGER